MAGLAESVSGFLNWVDSTKVPDMAGGSNRLLTSRGFMYFVGEVTLLRVDDGGQDIRALQEVG